ncbi:MAG: IS110 family transposase, partial [Planctomycetota bacterium]
MPFVGLDVHRREVEAAIVADDGALQFRSRFPATREAVQEFAANVLHSTDHVALEATTNTWGVVDLLRPHVAEVVVSNPLRTKAIAQAKIKTDRVDALVLAQLLRCDYLPRVWEPDEKTRRMRRLTSRRASLVADRTGIKNRVHSVLHQRLIPAPDDLFGVKGRAWLRAVELDEQGRQAVDSDLRLLDAVDTELAQLGRVLACAGYEEPRVRLLMTLPGVDLAVAQAIVAALGDVSRFPSGDHAAAYLGIVPRTHQSGDHCYHGPITKQGKGHVRWLVIQAAQHLDKHPGPLGVFFRRVAKRKNRNVAVVAAARKLIVIAWHMLRSNEPYRYADPTRTQGKLARLRIAATGKRRQGGIPKGSARPASYGTGNATRGVRSLDQAYQAEGLPPRAPLAVGEEAMLAAAGVINFVLSLAQPRREPKRRKVAAE